MSRHSSQQRDKIREKLVALCPEERAILSLIAVNRLISSRELRNCRHIGVFFPIHYELNIHPLIQYCWDKGIQTYLPSVLCRPFSKMIFHAYHKNSHMKFNRFGIPEPDCPAKKHISLRQLDIVITPLIGFSPQGQRLGKGGGFYDRTFAFQKRHKLLKRPRLWAIALDIQLTSIDTAPWDVPLQGIATESKLYRF